MLTHLQTNLPAVFPIHPSAGFLGCEEMKAIWATQQASLVQNRALEKPVSLPETLGRYEAPGDAPIATPSQKALSAMQAAAIRSVT